MPRPAFARSACVVIGVLAAVAVAAMDAQRLTGSQIRDRIVAESLASYPGNCPCPYNTDRAGRKCGARSAWSKPGGRSPMCYAKEVTDEQVRQFRLRLQVPP
jgi:hypothetical protein